MALNFFCHFSLLVIFLFLLFTIDISYFAFCILHTFAPLCFRLSVCSIDMVATDPIQKSVYLLCFIVLDDILLQVVLVLAVVALAGVRFSRDPI